MVTTRQGITPLVRSPCCRNTGKDVLKPGQPGSQVPYRTAGRLMINEVRPEGHFGKFGRQAPEQLLITLRRASVDSFLKGSQERFTVIRVERIPGLRTHNMYS